MPLPNKIMYKRKSKNLPGFLLKTILFNLTFIFISSFAFAAPPTGQSVGAEAERFKAQAERQKTQLQQKAKTPVIEVPTRPGITALPSVPFFLKKIVITGSTIFKPEEFSSIYQPYLNKEITFQDLETVMKAMESVYAKKGYLTTSAYIPPQDIKDGQVEIRVAEGKMGNLKIEGNKWFSSDLIERFFHSKKNQILNINELQRDVLRLNQSSDLEVKTVISAGQDPQSSDIVLQVKDKLPWHIGIGEDNQGTRLTGQYRTSFTLRTSNLTGNADSLFSVSLLSRDTFGQSISYGLPIGTNGTKFYFDTTYFKMRLGKEYGPQDITGQTQIYTPRLSWELALREDYQADFNLGIDIKSIVQKTAGEKTSDDQLRLPWFGFDFTKQDTTGQTSFSPKFSFSSSGFLGSSSRGNSLASRTGSGGSFFKYDQTLNRTQRMPFGSYLSMRSQFQAASCTLPASEQIQIGGAYSVRGYPEGDYLADIGGYLATEWIFPMYLIPKDWKLNNQKVPLRYQIQPLIFVDCGGGKLRKVIPGEMPDQFLAGVGGGVQLNFTGCSVKAQWAKAIGGDQPVSGSGPSTFYLTFQAEI